MKTYNVYFIDARDGYPNHKILEAANDDAVREYMAQLGHQVVKISER